MRQPDVPDKRPQHRPVLLLDVRVVVLAPRPRAPQLRLRPAARLVPVDHGVDQLRAVVRVDARHRERKRLQVAPEGRRVVGGVEVVARPGLEPLRPDVRRRGGPEIVSLGKAAAEGHAVHLDVARLPLSRGRTLAGDARYRVLDLVAPRAPVPTRPDAGRPRPPPQNSLHRRGAHAEHLGGRFRSHELKLREVLQDLADHRLEVLGVGAAGARPRLHEQRLGLRPVRLAPRPASSIPPAALQKAAGVLALQSRRPTDFVQDPSPAPSVQFPDVVLLLAQDVLACRRLAHGVHALRFYSVSFSLTKGGGLNSAPFCARCLLL